MVENTLIILFFVLVTIVALAIIILNKLVPYLTLRAEKKHEIDLKELEYEYSDSGRNMVETQLAINELDLKVDKVREGFNTDVRYVYEEIDELKEKLNDLEKNNTSIKYGLTKDEIDNIVASIRNNTDSKESEILKSLQTILDRLEKVELKVFNGIENPKLDIKVDTEEDELGDI